MVPPGPSFQKSQNPTNRWAAASLWPILRLRLFEGRCVGFVRQTIGYAPPALQGARPPLSCGRAKKDTLRIA